VANTDLRIDIASEFTGKRAFKQADSAVAGLFKSVRGLAGPLGLALLAAKTVQFGKESVKAFMADEKAAMKLTNTINNLGLSLSATSLESYVNRLSLATGVVDDELRPALQSLLQTTGSVTKSQELLALAVNVSRGSTVDLAQVANDLSLAYVGNTRGLRKYYLGLTQAELQASSFADLQERINTLFSGSNAAYLTTYAGKTERLSTAFGEFKEKVGKGVVYALLGAQGKPDSSFFLSFLEKAGDGIERFGIRAGNSIATLSAVLRRDMDAYNRLQGPQNFISGTVGSALQQGAIIQSKVAEAAAAKKERERLALAAKTTKEKKNQLALDKARLAITKLSANYDLTKISLAAALRGKVSEEEKKRLLELQKIEEIRQAIAEENGQRALELVAQLEAAQRKAADAELENQKRIQASLEARIAAIQAMMDKVQRKIDGNAAEALAAMSASSSSASVTIPVEQRIASVQSMIDKVQKKIDGNAAAASSGMSFSSASAGSYYADKLFSSPESLGLSDRANTERNAAMNINISLDGQAFQSAVVGAVNSASSSGTQLSYTQTAVR
jgi:hypothetical protein